MTAAAPDEDLAYLRVRDAITGLFEAMADATDTAATSPVRSDAAGRVAALAAAVMRAVEARHGDGSVGEQLTGHRYTLYRDGPPEYLSLTRVCARQLRPGDVLHGWVACGGVRFWLPGERIDALFGADTHYVTVRTDAGRDLILDSWVLVPITYRPV